MSLADVPSLAALFPEIPWQQLLLSWFAVAIGALVQGTIGFGIALIAAPMLLIIHPPLVPGPLMLATFFLTTLTWWRERAGVHWPDIPSALVGRFAGTLAGTYAMVSLPADILITSMGLLIVLAALLSGTTRPFQPSSSLLLWAGLLSGIMGTMTAAGGPPMLLAYQHTPGPRMRATLGAFFSIGIILSLTSLATVQRFGAAEILMGLSFVPPIIVGFLLSNSTIHRINRERVRNLALTLSAGSGLLIVLKSLAVRIF
ncbi:MAG: sulfite exporter TauE/SafE family protein [Magnetococcales bacterium]|nr:sulfite exporter TauE/SafE family protein [Magnetococcales bacterium]